MGQKAYEESYPQRFKNLNLELGWGRYDKNKVVVSKLKIGDKKFLKKSKQKKARGRTYLIEEIFISSKKSKVISGRFLRFFLVVFLSHPCSVVEVLSVYLCRFGYTKSSFYHHHSLSIYYCRFGFIYLLSLFFLSSLFHM